MGGGGVTLIDDCYNANPDSVRAAISVLAELPAPRCLLLGDMGEVGEAGLAFHEEVLAWAIAQGIESIWVIGNWMQQVHAKGMIQAQADAQGLEWRYWETHQDLIDGLKHRMAATPVSMSPWRSFLVKGSRFMHMEDVVQALEHMNFVQSNQ